jgi:hypothetical protein
MTRKPQTLPCTRLETGMPVIINHTQPCARIVAVITGFSQRSRPVTQYLNSLFGQDSMETDFDSVTCLEAFGVAIETNEADGTFRCVRVDGAPVTAVYPGGSPRQWRASDHEWWPYRPEVLAKLDKAYIIGNL